MKRSCVFVVAGALGPASCAVFAQIQEATFNFAFPQGAVFNGSMAIQVELWASYSPSLYAFNAYLGDVNGLDPTGMWDNLSSSLNIPSSLGVPTSGSVAGLQLQNLLFPPNFFPNTSNPLLLWSGEWSSSDLTPRYATLMTSTTSASAWNTSGQVVKLLEVIEASAQIQVIPAPPALSMLAISAGFVIFRRRDERNRA